MCTTSWRGHTLSCGVAMMGQVAPPLADDEEISQMKAKMEDMAREFGGMLKETLDKMRERIELSSTNLDVDVVPDGAAVEAYGV